MDARPKFSGFGIGREYYAQDHANSDDIPITPARKKHIVGQAFQPDSEPCQAGKPDLLLCRGNKKTRNRDTRAVRLKMG